MTDITLDRYITLGTAAERVAFVPDPGVAPAGEFLLPIWVESDTGDAYYWDNNTTSWEAWSGSTDPRVSSAASVASPLTWNSDNYDQICLTALANAITINADSGTPANGRKIIFRFKDNGTARALTWTTGSSKAFRAIGVTLPTTTVLSKTVYVGCVYNAADDRWDAVAVAQEA